MGIERIGLDDIGACLEILAVDVFDDLRLGQVEKIVVALEVFGPVPEPTCVTLLSIALIGICGEFRLCKFRREQNAWSVAS